MSRQIIQRLPLLFGLVLGLAEATTASSSHAGDWPQILGPHRNGFAANETIPNSWGPGGPKEVWKVEVGSGFAGVAVKSNHVILFHRIDEEEIVECLNADTGVRIWKHTSACSYAGGVSSDTGPRCVPLISETQVITLGVEGLLQCLDLASGQLIWKKDLDQDYSLRDSYFGVGSTPALWKNVLIVNVGGRGTSGIVGFDIKTGNELWKSIDDAASYSSPVVTSIHGEDHAIAVTRMNVVSLDPKNGKERFRFPFGKRGPTVNGATPVVMEERIFLTSSYGLGSLLVTANKSEASETWREPNLLASQYATPIAFGNHLFAVEGRQDAGAGSASLKCIDTAGPEVVWEESGFDYGTLIAVQNDLFFLTCGGDLLRIRANVNKFELIEKAHVLNRTDSGYRLPALAAGRLYVRDDNSLKALSLIP
ncbi:MAG: PQQ-binding-like beta-propeller repeat protein [Planctomyces sp.]|nr:PQQ-binding-like beta-propeller repeat protein [Planctomyces sp.]